jgi:hypothetical protein
LCLVVIVKSVYIKNVVNALFCVADINFKSECPNLGVRTFLQGLELTADRALQLDKEDDGPGQDNEPVWPTTHEPYLYGKALSGLGPMDRVILDNAFSR